MALARVNLNDKYEVESGQIYVTGTQALVRLPMMQRRRDARAGVNTACFISGYRGSPLGGFDQALWGARPFLDAAHVRFQPGVNEDLAATSIWGSQQLGLFPGAKYDGVFGIWYGKGPGVDRSGDVFKHANAAGSARFGGVLALAGDDHACKSSTLPHQSEFAFVDAQIPVLNPANVQDILALGLYGWEMSRYSGCWVAMKTVAEVVDSSASIHVDDDALDIVTPDDFEMPEGGLNIRWPDPPMAQELRLMKYKLYAALAFARANRLDRTVVDSPAPRFGIVTTGKAYLDVCQALDDLGIDADHAGEIGLRVYKVGMSWPLEREGIRRFAEGLEEILVVEEKRALIENQLKEQLYNWREDVRPRVIGKFDENRQWILPSNGELTPAMVARVIAARIARIYTSDRIEQRLRFLEQKEAALGSKPVLLERRPHFCAGCPHNTSTRVPEGSRALAGIGCHYMAQWMDRNTDTFTQMGGEGVPWVGQAPFTETSHVFANLGDGTYFHSGSLALRALVASGANITVKVLYNDAVAMTGGQPVDGPFSVAHITHQAYGEGIRRIAVVTDEPDKYPDRREFAAGTTFHHRDALDTVQRQLRDHPGTSLIIYDQVCAAEKRRRRKRGRMPDPPQRVFINEQVCEGCGDCSVQSNCLAVIPVETELGRKRAIDQSACNKDFSCLKGFCPSFVSVHGGSLRKPRATGTERELPLPPPPTLPSLDQPRGILVTGVGGTGVVTIGALLGMAAHIEGKGVSVLDQTGLAQKYGAVTSHVRIAATPQELHAVRIAAGGADLLLGCDLVVAASRDALAKLETERSHAVINTHETITAEFVADPDLNFPSQGLLDAVTEAAGVQHTHTVDATGLATRALGDSIAANLFMVGYAWQKGFIPIGEQAILDAIELNGVAVDFNRQAFRWGRCAAADPAAVAEALGDPAPAPRATTLDALIARRVELLTAYQSARYARRYTRVVERVRKAEAERAPGFSGLTAAVAHNYYRVLAYKDEYEVARLYSDPAFRKALEERFEGDYRLGVHLAPPLLARRDPQTGHLLKREFGPWIMRAFSLLAPLKFLRGTPLDPFGYTRERRAERELIAQYEQTVDSLLDGLDHDQHPLAIEIASLPEHIRGFGHIKDAAMEATAERRRMLLEAYRRARDQVTAA